ncbi:MAG: hypothetical protein WHV66_00225 [Anaerolineales bacterium]
MTEKNKIADSLIAIFKRTLPPYDQPPTEYERVFVVVVERQQNGEQLIVDWGRYPLSDLAAWIAFGSEKKP